MIHNMYVNKFRVGVNDRVNEQVHLDEHEISNLTMNYSYYVANKFD